MNLLKYTLSIAKYEIFNKFGIRRKPRVLQLPVTSRCNSRCKTCNIWKDKANIDINCEDLKKILSAQIFSRVESVGINGGEITLLSEFEKLVDVILTIKSLKSLHIITNGILDKRLLEYLIIAKEKCKSKGVLVNCCLSIDGVGHIHDQVRGIPNSFIRSERILTEMKNNYLKYCDNFTIGCTISKYNIPYIIEVDNYLSQFPFYVEYHLAVPNKRIRTFDDYDDYYILADRRKTRLAQEFFFAKFNDKKLKLSDRIKYFINYEFLSDNHKKRLARCEYLYRDITVDENLNLYLCATASEKAGNLSGGVNEIATNKELNKLAKTNKSYCNGCNHYIATPNLIGLWTFVSYKYMRAFSIHKSKLLCKQNLWSQFVYLISLLKKAFKKLC